MFVSYIAAKPATMLVRSVHLTDFNVEAGIAIVECGDACGPPLNAAFQMSVRRTRATSRDSCTSVQ